jgi:PRTRC genetic system protein A
MSGRPLVGHLVARDGLPERRGLAYDYVVAGDGVFLATENELLSVRVPVARCAVRGLVPVYPACTLLHGRLPVHLWRDMLRLARGVAVLGREVLFTVVHDHAAAQAAGAAAGYRLDVPDQVAGAARVAYRPPGPGTRVALELHSHHTLPARFSRTDDADEQRLCLYGVIGRLDRPRPEVALRVGAYGHYLPLPWESVFDGGADDRAAVHDAHFDGPYADGGPDAAGDNEIRAPEGDVGHDGHDPEDRDERDVCAPLEGAAHAEAEATDDQNRGRRPAWGSDRRLPTRRRLSLWHELRD